MILVWRLVIGIARRNHHALHTCRHHLVEVSTNRVWISSIKERRVGSNSETGRYRRTHSLHGDIVTALTAHGKIMVFTLTIDVYRERKIFARFEQVQLLFQQQSIRAHVNILLPSNQAGNDLRHLRMKKWFASRN